MPNSQISSAAFPDSKPHFELLDGLRGVAALLVVVYHIFEGFAFAGATGGVGSGLITTLNHGYLAVDFFFMLSGFVISYSYDDRWKKMSAAQFFKRRIIRLQPMLVMGAVLGAITYCIQGCQQWDGSKIAFPWVMLALVLTMLMIPAVPGSGYEVRGNGEMFPLNGPTWSLFFEYIAYLLYAFFIRRLSTVWLSVLVGLLSAGYTVFAVFDLSGYGNIGVGWTLDGINFGGGLLRMLVPFTIIVAAHLVLKIYDEPLRKRMSRNSSIRILLNHFWVTSSICKMHFPWPLIVRIRVASTHRFR